MNYPPKSLHTPFSTHRTNCPSQNYTCASSTASPVQIGAVATLYNATCIAAEYPSQLQSLPTQALSLPSGAAPINLLISGVHYFVDTTTPTFNMDTILTGSLGFTFAKKLSNVTAPAGSNPGVPGQAYGAVPWLKLEHETTGELGPIREVYRLNTAGGQPPSSCTDQVLAPEMIQVQYAAEYWFWAGGPGT